MAEPWSMFPEPEATPDRPAVVCPDKLAMLGQMLGETWPAKLVKSALSAAALPGDVYSGRTPMVPGSVPDEAVIGRATDLAGLVMGGTGFGAPAGAFGSGPVRRAAALPMDDASRMARARDLGFNVDEKVFHETSKKFDEFKPQYGSQVWFTTDPATFGQNGAAATNHVFEGFLKHNKLAGWKEYDKYGTDELVRMGYDGARLGSDIVIFDPKNIRSVDAAFDPKNVDSAKLLGSGFTDARGVPFSMFPALGDE